jgi:hypothetical protein
MEVITWVEANNRNDTKQRTDANGMKQQTLYDTVLVPDLDLGHQKSKQKYPERASNTRLQDTT